jgi:hypothetical protein
MELTRTRARRSQMSRTIVVVVICLFGLAGIGVWSASHPQTSTRAQLGITPVSVFTFVSTGIVFIEPETGEIVRKNKQNERRTVGEGAWRNPQPAERSELTGFPAWRDNRDIIGNPDYNLVSWVETRGRTRGDLIVVKASTGAILARTTIQAPPERSVVLASVTDEVVYFATPDPATGFPDIPGSAIWVWRWAEGEDPVNLRSSRYYNDVSAGTWAVYGNGLEFEDVRRQTLATVRLIDKVFTDFGGALSPDGRYWYGAGGSHIVETATGSVINISVLGSQDYGWTADSKLTLINPFAVCSARTGQCVGPPDFSPNGACTPYGVDCDSHPPVN